MNEKHINRLWAALREDATRRALNASAVSRSLEAAEEAHAAVNRLELSFETATEAQLFYVILGLVTLCAFAWGDTFFNPAFSWHVDVLYVYVILRSIIHIRVICREYRRVSEFVETIRASLVLVGSRQMVLRVNGTVMTELQDVVRDVLTDRVPQKEELH